MFDVIVIGAGAIGMATAHYLSKLQVKTMLIEQVSITFLPILLCCENKIIFSVYKHPNKSFMHKNPTNLLES